MTMTVIHNSRGPTRMPDLSPISPGLGVGPTQRATQGSERRGQQRESSASPRAADRVEFSDMARYLNMLNELPEVRADLVQRVRDEIESGTYDTPERFEAAIEQLARDLDITA